MTKITKGVSTAIFFLMICSLVVAYTFSPFRAQVAPAWLTYTDPQFGFSFQYPNALRPVTTIPELFDRYTSFGHYADQHHRIYFDFPTSYTSASTTGILSDISFGVSADNTTSCAKLGGTHEFPSTTLLKHEKATINGINYDTSVVSGCGGAYCLDIYQYSTVSNGLCFRANLVIDAQAPFDATTPDDAATADYKETETKLKSVFQRMLATFIFLH